MTDKVTNTAGKTRRKPSVDTSENTPNSPTSHKPQTSARLPVFWPAGLTPLPHQLVAVEWALSRDKSYLALDPGLGKTIVAALVSNRLPDFKVFYVCPPFLTKNTENEFQKWCDGRVPFLIPDSMLTKPETRKRFEDALVTTSPEKRILFIDEAHRFKNFKADRTHYLFQNYARRFERVVFLSGTPMPNSRPMELWPAIRFGAPDVFGHNFFTFALKYCGAFKGPFGWNFQGFTNRKEFKIRITRRFMLRQKKELLDLPPKIEGLLTVGGGETPQELSNFEAAIRAHHSYQDIVKGDVLEFHDIKNPDVHLMTYLRLLGGYKLKYALPFIEDLLETTKDSLLLFGLHKSVIAGLAKKLGKYKPIVITGDVPKDKRQALVKEFQENPERRVFIGNIQAAGVGFTLTKASRVLFVEFSWVDGDNQQASDRAHRIGQKDSVLVQYVVLKDSIDHARMEVLLRKRKQAI
jgi:SWI/SNF-related matrix-associated actin-dependent regulator 1 of chromatin subfamily A